MKSLKVSKLRWGCI